MEKQGKTREMKDEDLFWDLLTVIKKCSSQLIAKEISLSDYYFKMADYFNTIEPHKGENRGNWFNFKNDAQDLIQLAKKQLKKESECEK